MKIPDVRTTIRFLETFIVTLLIGAGIDFSSHGAVNLGTPEGQQVLWTAIGAGLVLAIRRAQASP